MRSPATPRIPDGRYALDLLWVGLLALYAFAGVAAVPFHGDESMQVFMSRDYAYLFQDGDLAELRYSEEKAQNADLEQNLRIINGTVNKFAVGLAWGLAGFTRDDLNAPWYWDETYDFNVRGGFAPPDALLGAARVPSALFLSGAVIAIFFAGMLFAGRPAAYMATLYLALSPAVLLNGRRAMMEGSLLFGALLTLVGGLWLVRGEGRGWGAVALIGAASGFAVASKHTNVIAVIAVFVGCLLYGLANGKVLGFIVRLSVAGVLSLAVFVALNPTYWGNPVQTAAAVVDERTALIGGQVGRFGGYDSFGERALGFYIATFDGRPQYYELESFRGPLAPQIAAYEATPYAGVYMPGVGVAILGAFTLGLLIVLSVVSLPDVHPGTRWVVGTYAIVTTLFCLLAVPLPWQRYYLPMFPIIGLIAPLGLLWVVRLYLRNAREESPQYKKGSARVQRS